MQITHSVHALRLPFTVPVAPGVSLQRFVNIFMIYGETITLIDTGVAGCEKAIFDYIRSTGRDPSEISLIIQTHSHPDHIGAAKAIRAATGCSIAAHPAERAWIENVDLQNSERPVPGFSVLVGGSVPVDFDLGDGDSIDPDGTGMYDLQVFHTPGHSPGSISVFLHNEGVLFTGDAIPVPGELPVYDDAIESVRAIKNLISLRGIKILLSAWDEPRKREEPYLQMDRALSWLQKIHNAVITTAATCSPDNPEFTKKVADLIGLSPNVVNPLLTRTFAANLKIRKCPDILQNNQD
jgi:hydroxyacylglutathione hydrolase